MEIDDEDKQASSTSFDYLLNMQFWSLSHEKIEEIEKEKWWIETELDWLSKKDIKDMWIEDLDEFVLKYEENLKSFIDQENNEYTKVAIKGKIKPMNLQPLGVSKELAPKPLTAR